MHELSIVMSIVDIANEEAEKHHAKKVDSIELQIGTMAGVEFDALEFAWDVGVRNTILQGCEKKIDLIQARGRCTDCGTEYFLSEGYAPCPVCNNCFIEYLSGKELRVKSLIVS